MKYPVYQPPGNGQLKFQKAVGLLSWLVANCRYSLFTGGPARVPQPSGDGARVPLPAGCPLVHWETCVGALL